MDLIFLLRLSAARQVIHIIFPCNQKVCQTQNTFLSDLLDFVGLAFVLSKIPGKGHSKLLTAAAGIFCKFSVTRTLIQCWCFSGWATAEIILSKGLILWRARGSEFSWLYTQKALESNILLIVTIASATLLWLFSRNDLNRRLVPVVVFLLLAIAFRSVWLDGTLFALGFNPWSSLLVKGAISIFGFGLPTVYLYSSMSNIV